ncbi:GNAT family N-acetyltransferase [Allokutzneria sp. A3M-2-11 16]|uniref:GNAT family N-acetyltransferase n=1 Tax=Allokutzneria sp. A3M-2-11 16 TaxID=2962043 RepID=UPI0020B821D6|nr:GNAT family N-acetyltransferase [Allokutzneria sp. A3M-2-11 16]MCP3797886.1 GNAT family N-acetyltransferase [Allokutzneria sp. A3M-2-11 16]
MTKTERIQRRATGNELSAEELYRILRLRVDVFVVEQKAAYPELDGRDLAPSTVHLWWETDDPDVGEAVVLAYARVLDEPNGTARIGRVVTAAPARGQGLSRALMETALTEIGDQPSVLDAQTQVADFYTSLGYRVIGDEFLDDDGIPHVPMHRP